MEQASTTVGMCHNAFVLLLPAAMKLKRPVMCSWNIPPGEPLLQVIMLSAVVASIGTIWETLMDYQTLLTCVLARCRLLQRSA